MWNQTIVRGKRLKNLCLFLIVIIHFEMENLHKDVIFEVF